MSPFESIGTSQKTPKEEVDKELNKIEQATTLEEEADAKKMGLTIKDYQELNKIPISNEESQVAESSSVEGYIKKWERENGGEVQYEYEQIDGKTEIINNTPYAMSEFFLAAIVRSARAEIWNDRSQRYPDKLLNNLSNVFRIEIKEIKGTDNLQFDIYVNKRSLTFKKQTEIVFLKMYPNGEIKLS